MGLQYSYSTVQYNSVRYERVYDFLKKIRFISFSLALNVQVSHVLYETK